MKFRMIIGVVLTSGIATLAHSQAFFDDFNRADSGDLGAAWTNVGGSQLGILGNRAFSTTGDNALNIVTGLSNAVGTHTVTVDADATESGYVAISMGYANNGMDGGIYFKLQSNGSGTFSNYAFYTGFNNISGSYTSGGGFFAHAFTYGVARIKLSVAGDVITAEVDGDINGSIDDTFQATMGAALVSGLGTSDGLGVWGSARADNFNVVVPEPGTFVAIGVGLAGLSLARRKRS